MKKLITLFLLLVMIMPISRAQDGVDSLEIHLEQSEGADRIQILNELAKSQWYVSPEKNIEYSTEALQLSKRLDKKKGEADALNSLGIGHYLQGKLDESLEYFMKSLSIRETINDQTGVASCLNNIAMIHVQWEQFDDALEDYQRSLTISQSLNDGQGIMRAFNNIGWLHKQSGRLSEALDSFQKALDWVETSPDPNSKIYIQNNMGEIYFAQGQYQRALAFFNVALSAVRKSGLKERTAWGHHNVGLTYLKLNQLRDARYHLLESLNISAAENFNELISENNKSLSELYALQGQYETALTHYQRFKASADSVFNEERSRQIVEMQTKYDSERQKQQIGLLERDREIQDLRLHRQRLAIIGLFSGLIVVGIFSTIILRQERRLRKQKEDLEDALAQIKTLSGLLPICAHCKKIRDDSGYWNQLEAFITDHSDATFSHGICPGCLDEHYPDLNR